jgi:hypothetical protein
LPSELIGCIRPRPGAVTDGSASPAADPALVQITANAPAVNSYGEVEALR